MRVPGSAGRLLKSTLRNGTRGARNSGRSQKERSCKGKRAGDGIRTRDPQLGRLMLYQLSYSRLSYAEREMRNDSPRHLFRTVGREGFEPPKA